ncbi:MAG: response regulator [Rhodospirillaceae bacterium]|jgi:two-component system, chemotaxis family, chemotaxis protein CheY|nr:response regulator [Rhodospirillaceae bacterium]
MSDQNSRYVLDALNVLVVDDNRHMRSLVQSILHALGVKNVVEAGDAAQAFKELLHFNADVIIADWHMEPLDGLDFVRLVRTAKDSPNPYVPIIMLSGYTEYRRVTEARDAGINEFLAKPISAKSLYLRFASIIDNPRPFIRTKSYFGPDRRRQNLGPPRGTAERRKDAQESAGAGSSDADDARGLSTDEVQNLMKS